MTTTGDLQRKLGLGDAVAIGLGSMIGAGGFAAFAPAATAAGPGLLIGLAIAAVVAYCNATSSAQLAVRYPASGRADASRLTGTVAPAGFCGILQSAGLFFFAFAGYARSATMGEEVRSLSRTIPRAILIALFGALAVYGVIAVAALSTLGAGRLAATTTLLADVAAAGGWEWTGVVVRIGAAAAALGALLCLVLVVTLPIGSIVGSIVVVAAGVLYRVVLVRRRDSRAKG
ncbi:amino acid permease [Kocuria sp. cx-455]|uniref:amino acid permease n=1 Tax=Kocuria sp. cx-455 TaxID=2771377 RepID=UPI0016843A51|nr:amino acid permease [Kocuria sp. cx-455]MBD2765570.1 amino acid permease [Kocuria sp. cx-455]